MAGVPEPYGKNTQLIYEYVSEPINWTLERPELLDLPKAEALRRISEQLDIAAARVDRFMLGELSGREWFVRRVAGGLALLVIVAVFTLTIRWVWRSFTKQEQMLGEAPPFSKTRYAYLMILPGLLLILFVAYLPLVLGIPLALFDYQLALGSRFVGLTTSPPSSTTGASGCRSGARSTTPCWSWGWASGRRFSWRSSPTKCPHELKSPSDDLLPAHDRQRHHHGLPLAPVLRAVETGFLNRSHVREPPGAGTILKLARSVLAFARVSSSPAP